MKTITEKKERGMPQAMHCPAHPGEILWELYLKELQLNVGEAAQRLGVTRKTLSALINARQGVSPVMALRLAKAFDTTPELWLNLQRQHDLWHARQAVDLSTITPLRKAQIA